MKLTYLAHGGTPDNIDEGQHSDELKQAEKTLAWHGPIPEMSTAFADRELANAVARHKAMFFAEKAADRSPIDYAAAVNGDLQLVPAGAKALEEGYARMVDEGLLLQEAEPFDALMARCTDIAARANHEAERQRDGRPAGESL